MGTFIRNLFKSRITVSALAIGLVFAVLVVSLFNLTVVKGEGYSSLSQSSKTRTLTTTGKRGSIYDTNMIPLAYDEDTYDVRFYREAGTNTAAYRAAYTQSLREAIAIIEEEGKAVLDTFSIVREEDGNYTFNFNTTDETVFAKREKLWRSNMYLTDTTLTPYDCYMRLRDTYQIPEDVSYEEAHKLLSIWQETQYTQYLTYSQVTVAADVSATTVARIESRPEALLGVSIATSTKRVYPKGEHASHILGYTGRIYDADQLTALAEKGYTADATVGVTGIESTMEDSLTSNITSRKGMELVEVDTYGRILQVLDSTQPLSGNDVVLNLDYELQTVVEDALARTIESIRAEQDAVLADPEQLADYTAQLELVGRKVEDLNLADTGAAVVMNCNTGAILAMASYPDYDPNLFIGGISEEEYAVYAEDTRSPLFNKAISTMGMPGSVFKMVTGLGALMEGVVTVDTEIDDGGPWAEPGEQPTDTSPRCWVRPDYYLHTAQNIVSGLKNSCNYYFMTLAYGLGIDQLNRWGELLGLTTLTNVELPSEAVGHIGNQLYLYDNTKSIGEQASYTPFLVHRKLYTVELVDICTAEGVEYTEDQLKEVAEKLMKVVGTDETWGPTFRRILREDLGISETITNAKGYDTKISQRLYELRWTPTLTVTSGIGQARVQVTPIAVARYISALVNGGTVYEAQLVDKVLNAAGEVVEDKQPVVANALEADPEYLSSIREGMKEVVNAEDGGTAATLFENFEYVDNIGGKTGTAQVSTIDLENDSWFVCFTPFDDTEIVVVVYVPHGYKGSNSAQAVKEVVQFYLDRQKNGGA